MAPGYIETPYDITDKHWYTTEGDPHTIRTNGPGSIASHPSSSSSTPSFKSYHIEDQSFDFSLKNLQDAYRCLPLLDYEYKAQPRPKALKQPKSVNGHTVAAKGMRVRAHREAADSTNVDHNAPATRVASGGAGMSNQGNMGQSSMRAELPAPDYEYEVRRHRAHATPVDESIRSKKVSARHPSRRTALTIDAYESYDQQPGASWYRPPPPTSTSTSYRQNLPAPKESTSWYRSRPSRVAPKRPVLRRSKAKVTRVNVVRISLVAATPNQRREGVVKTWYADVKKKLFRTVKQNQAL